MLCSHCNKREANFHYKQVTNGKYTELHLCGECATELGYLSADQGFGLEDMLGELLGFGGGVTPGMAVCQDCGTTAEQLKKTGTVGCSSCYNVFEKDIENILSRIQPATEHKGKLAGEQGEQLRKKSEVKQLKELLNKAISDERYEDAAHIRDKIKDLEMRGEQNG